MLGFMSFDFPCEVCGKEISKTNQKLSMWQNLADGGVIECKECKTRYKSQFNTSYFHGIIGFGSLIVGVLCILWFILMMNYSSSIDSVVLPAVLAIVGFMVIQVICGAFTTFFIPVRKMSADDENF